MSRSRPSQVIRVLIITTVLAMVVTACSRADPSTYTTPDTTPLSTFSLPIPTATPRTAPTPTPRLEYHVISDFGSSTMPSEWLVNEGELIVIGTIVDALPPRWGTPDGLPPPDPVAAIQRGMRIITSYVLEVEGEPIVNRLSSTETDERLMPALALATLGGQIDGLAYYDSYPTRHFEIGERALVVLHSSAQRTTGVDVMTPYGPAWDVRHKYVLDRYSQALSFAGQIREPADDLIARIREADERIPLAAPERPPPPRSQ